MATFRVGLSMAGAISAGAYTGGVFDFLIEALDEWERAKQALRDKGTPVQDWDVPSHDVVIPVMTGASAGGITGALGIIALAEKPPAGSVPTTYRYPQLGDVVSRLPRLYNAWVKLPSFVSPTGAALLGTQDLARKDVRSLLDTTVLDKIVEATLRGIEKTGAPRPYIAKSMHLYMTHTNMRGVPYAIKFTGGVGNAPGYPMMCHADRVHYRVNGLGNGLDKEPSLSKWADGDPAQQIEVKTLEGLTTVEGPWKEFADVAVGSGAFPVGLRAREVVGGTVDDYDHRRWPVRRQAGISETDPAEGQPFEIKPAFPRALAGDLKARVDYVTCDGGIIDNEPFELARWTLMANPPEPNPREAEKADRAGIMIDPFPEAPDYAITDPLDTALVAIIKKLLPTLIDQARFKLDAAADALDEAVSSRFLISPRRRSGPKPDDPFEPYAIACGLLGGFGGFVSEEFRAHDYQLGRFNCYWFLKNSFALPLAGQKILDGAYGNAARIERFATKSPIEGDATHYYQIIPLVDGLTPPAPPKSWPRITRKEVETLVAHADTRADAVVKKLIATEVSSRILRWGLQVAWPTVIRDATKNYIRWVLIQNLTLRDQLEEFKGWDADRRNPGWDADERKVIAALADPRFDLRTVAGIAKQYQLDRTFVARCLAKLGRLATKGDRKGSDDTYRLEERAPKWWRSITDPLGLTEPTVD